MKCLVERPKIQNILLYFVAFFIVYESGTLPSIVSIKELYIDKVLLLISIGIGAIIALKKKKSWNHLFFWGALFLLFILINSLTSPETTSKLVYRLFIFLLIYLFLLHVDSLHIDFDRIVCNVIVFFAVTSLVIYVLVHFLSVPIPYNYFYLGESRLRFISYGGIYYEQGYPNVQFGLSIYRMTGPYWEPGVYQIFLNYALYRYTILDKGNKIIIFILLVDLLLTMSASGWLCAIAIIFFWISRSKKLRLQSKKLITILLLIIGMLSAGFVLFSKFSETYANKSSAYIRVYDFLLALQLFLENPIFGTGFQNVGVFEIRNTYNGSRKLGSSNGLMTLAYTTGVIGLIFIFYPFISCLKKSKSSDKFISIFYLGMILFFNFVEPVYYFPFMIYILAKQYRALYNNITFNKLNLHT